MGILSTLGNVFGSLIFTISLGLLVTVIALGQFTNYSNLQPILSNVVANQIAKTNSPSDLSNIDSYLKQQCGGSATQTSMDLGSPPCNAHDGGRSTTRRSYPSSNTSTISLEDLPNSSGIWRQGHGPRTRRCCGLNLDIT